MTIEVSGWICIRLSTNTGEKRFPMRKPKLKIANSKHASENLREYENKKDDLDNAIVYVVIWFSFTATITARVDI